VQFLAAAVAFYAFVSIIPLALLGLAVLQFIDGGLAAQAVAASSDVLTPSAQAIVADAVSSSAGRGGATIVGLGFLAWSGIRVFRGLDVAFSHVYGRQGPEPLATQLVDAAIVLAAIPVAFGAAAVLGVVLPLLEGVPLMDIIGRLVLPLVLFLVFLPIYYRFPDVRVTVREVVPGTVFAAVGWAVLAVGFSFYTGTVATFHLYGVLGAGLLLVTWLYLGGSIIMVGAVLNAVLAGRPDDRSERTAERDGEPAESPDSTATEPAPDIGGLASEVRALRSDLEDRTVSRSALEGELQRYVRRRVRRGKARGWGPYLVLLYGTAMTLGAFYWLSGGWAILAMIVVWLSTLGLYVLMLLVGAGISVAGVPGRLSERVRDFRS